MKLGKILKYSKSGTAKTGSRSLICNFDPLNLN
jgi:hypothetical protein